MRAIGPPLTDEERTAMMVAARSLAHKVRFRHQGRDPATGLDCSGFLVWLIKSIGRPVYDRPNYGRDPHKDGLRQAVERNLGPAVADAPKHGDVILMHFGGKPRHVGLIAAHPEGGLLLVHAWATKKKVTEHAYSGEWIDRTVAVFRP